MTTTIKAFIALAFLAVLFVLDLSPWANALLLAAYFILIIFGPAIRHLARRA